MAPLLLDWKDSPDKTDSPALPLGLAYGGRPAPTNSILVLSRSVRDISVFGRPPQPFRQPPWPFVNTAVGLKISHQTKKTAVASKAQRKHFASQRDSSKNPSTGAR